MAQADVEAVFGPQWVQDALRFERGRARMAEKIILALRRELREADPSLPMEYDGTAWAEIERIDHAA